MLEFLFTLFSFLKYFFVASASKTTVGLAAGKTIASKTIAAKAVSAGKLIVGKAAVDSSLHSVITGGCMAIKGWIYKYHSAKWFASGQVSLFYGVGDISAQCFEMYWEKHGAQYYDIRRTGRRMAWGAVAGPILNAWYAMIGGWRVSNVHAINLALRTAADQLGFTPIFLIYFLFIQEFLRKFSFSDAQQAVKDDLFKIWGRNLCFWTPASLINYAFIKSDYRLVFMNTVGYFWDALISYWVG